MAKPSGNNSLTFFMPEEEEEEEEEEFAAADAEEDINSVGAAHPADEEENVGDNQSLGDMPRERQLTQKFLAGQLSFKDLMQVLGLLLFHDAGLKCPHSAGDERKRRRRGGRGGDTGD